MPTYYGFRFQQRAQGPVFCLFHAPAPEILTWSDIDRLGPGNTSGIQRGQNKYKIGAIKSFFSADEINTIPTAVIVAVEGAQVQAVALDEQAGAAGLVRLQIENLADGSKPGLVIDGQHRLLGIQELGAALPIPVVAILDASDAEKAFQFVVINNKASKVPPDHIKALRLNVDEGAVSKRLQKVRLGFSSTLPSVKVADTADESPFKGIIDWELNAKDARRVPPTAIESAVAHIMQQQKVFEDKEFAEQFFFSMWNAIKEKYPIAWAEKDSKLIGKVGVICLTSYLSDSLVSFNRISPAPVDFGDSNAVKEQVRLLLNSIPEEFWTTPWSMKSLDTAAGRQLVVQALAAVTDNVQAKEKWYADVTLVDASQKAAEDGAE